MGHCWLVGVERVDQWNELGKGQWPRGGVTYNLAMHSILLFVKCEGGKGALENLGWCGRSQLKSLLVE